MNETNDKFTMKKLATVLAAVFAMEAVAVMAAPKKEPVLMTIDGKDITLAEFEYLYHKSNSQQASVQPVDEYLDMFVNFKLKVADAEAAGLDTTAAFRKEYNDYRRQLAEPYLIDSAAVEGMIRRAYSHLGEEIEASHIMVNGFDAEKKLDSIRTRILNGEISFEDAAREYSIDPSAARNGGYLGAVTAGSTPYLFEDALYATAPGEISPVIFSGVAFHIIKVKDRRPARGEVKASHILKMTRGLSDDMKEKARCSIDSIYALVTGGADFADLARRESQDPGSAAQGGSLGWFGPHMMVQPFDSISFALPVGAVSEPFATAFGYHIIYKEDSRGVMPYDSIRGAILSRMERDGRIDMARAQFADSLAKAYGNGMTATQAVDTYIDNLPTTHPEYRNLLNEYRDGILLFDISNARVWDKAANDEAGLNAYFEANRDKYAWDKPRYKGYVVYATSDSLLTSAMERIARLGDDVSADSIARDLRGAFGKGVKLERVLTGKGDNAVVDYVAFNGPKPAAKRVWKAYAPLRGRVIEAPESAADVRGAVTTDYQGVLESTWLDELHKRYRVKVNKKVLKQVK